MFVGREKELSLLQDAYDIAGQNLTIVYGRRRIGKTVLLEHFFSGKDGIWFTAFDGNANLLLKSLCDVVNMAFPSEEGIPRRFDNLDDIFAFVFRKSEKKKFLFVIDEFPYLALQFPESASLLQMYLDKYKEKGNLKLILSGSSMHFMEHQVLGKESPLYGRRDLSIKLCPFGLRETKELLSSYSTDEDVFRIWAITGGIPLYLSLFNKYAALEDAVLNMFFSDNGYFANEVSNIFLMEFRSPQNYESVCTLLASGINKVSDISNKSGLSSSLVASILDTLLDLDIVEQEYSVTPRRRKPIWKIKDPLILFWYRFRYPFSAYPSNRMLAYFKEHFTEFLGNSFEKLCLSIIPLLYPNTLITEIGRWWGNSPKTKSEEEIDIVARTTDSTIILGECKYTNKPIGNSILAKLKERATLVASDENIQYVLFSKSGFSMDTNEDNVLTLEFDEVFKIAMNL